MKDYNKNKSTIEKLKNWNIIFYNGINDTRITYMQLFFSNISNFGYGWLQSWAYYIHKQKIFWFYTICYGMKNAVKALVSICYTQRNIFDILINQTEIRFLPFSNWFETKQTSIWFQINREM